MNKKEKDLKLLKAILGDWDGLDWLQNNKLHTQRDELSDNESAPYHETGPARKMAFKNGWDACLQHVMNVLSKK